MAYAKLFDSSKCIACRGCQKACKNWNQDPAEKTTNRGTHQNPPDLSHQTRTVVRFKEQEGGDLGIIWTFFKDSCRHCIEPACKMIADGTDEQAVVITDTGAVIYNERTAKVEGMNCGYNIPKQEKDGAPYVKCTLCFDRITNGLQPACVTTCPTGALEFGKREDIVKLALQRVEEAKKRYPDAHISSDYKEVNYIQVFHYKEDMFEMYADREKQQKIKMASRRDLLNPKKAAGMISKLLG
ncbi:MAG TPA: formate dehydrogenase [bacterium]|nr:MAG: Formate dehydrogenase subunit beta [bacterium ADurb.Bin236]HOC92095.1 formate dehydrogenase [bacterium]HPI75887.1 formate dehydrogenase [bacterium]HPN93480.1 formate dehydrogenase [bacterium]